MITPNPFRRDGSYKSEDIVAILQADVKWKQENFPRLVERGIFTQDRANKIIGCMEHLLEGYRCQMEREQRAA